MQYAKKQITKYRLELAGIFVAKKTIMKAINEGKIKPADRKVCDLYGRVTAHVYDLQQIKRMIDDGAI